MTIPTTIPARDALKTQAKRLRADLALRDQTMTHAQALETIAHQWGARDWNTLSAQVDQAHVGWAPGQRVTGRYLGQSFAGAVKAARASSSGMWSLTLRFDDAIDVVESIYFSNLRRQVSVTVTKEGRTPLKTSNGQPHLVLDHL